MIKHISLDHGWYYFYRVHTERLDYLPKKYSQLSSYFLDMLEKCPDEKFHKGPRSSKLKFNIGIKPKEIETHPVCTLAEEGLDWNHYKTAHSNVQVYMLNNDPGTLAVEVPIWLENKELSNFEKLFSEKGPLSGHIDLIRMEGDKIWIWDYKPNAHREKYATTQTFFYALMLSQRTGIPLKNFMCGYFDENTSFVFKPQAKIIEV